MEEIILTAVETISGVGTLAITKGAIAKVVPEGLSKAERICVGVGTVTTSIAIDQIVCRETRRFYKDTKRELKKTMKKFKKKNYHSNHKSSNNHKNNSEKTEKKEQKKK